MGLFSPHLTKTVQHIDPLIGALTRNDPIGKWATGYLTKKVPTTPVPPPNADTAANSDAQQQQLLLRRRGILGNIFAGNSAAPATGSKTALGS